MVLKLNKLGQAAASVRHDFITTLLARKTSPKGAAVFIAQCLAADPGLLEQHGGRKQATDMLGANPAKSLDDDNISDNRPSDRAGTRARSVGGTVPEGRLARNIKQRMDSHRASLRSRDTTAVPRRQRLHARRY